MSYGQLAVERNFVEDILSRCNSRPTLFLFILLFILFILPSFLFILLYFVHFVAVHFVAVTGSKTSILSNAIGQGGDVALTNGKWIRRFEVGVVLEVFPGALSVLERPSLWTSSHRRDSRKKVDLDQQ